jgi:hypothetical protein
MKLTFLGIIFKDEPNALFSADFENADNGVYSMGTAEFRVSLPMIGVTDGRTVLTEGELERAKEMILDEIKQSLKVLDILPGKS